MPRSTRLLLAGGVVVVLVGVLGTLAWDDRSDDSTGATTTAVASDAVAADAPATTGPAVTDAPEDPAERGVGTEADRPRRSFTFAATGDFLLHAPVVRRAKVDAGGSGYSFAPMLARTSPIISGVDVAICHMETPLSPDDTSLSGYPLFNVPREIAADAAAAGYDGCSTASNHSLDKGVAGVRATLDVLDSAGLRHAGTARSAVEAVTPTIYDVNGARFGHLSYAYGTNGNPVPAEQPWSVNVIDPAKILADAAATRQAGADFVAVSLQWGNEYQSAPTAEQRALAQQLLASPDIDFIIGSHVHVVQPIERVGDEYVAYGVGNFLSNQGAPSTPTPSQDGMILQVAVGEQPDGSFRATKVSFTPTWVDRSTYVVTLATPESNPASYERTVAASTSLGPAAYDGAPLFTPIEP